MVAHLGLSVLGLASLTACQAVEPVVPHATVSFVLDAPLCSSTLPVQFFIDSSQAGTDTFYVGLTPAHTISRGFGVPPGQHAIGARVVAGFVWPDTLVTLAAGEFFADTLHFYCS